MRSPSNSAIVQVRDNNIVGQIDNPHGRFRGFSTPEQRLGQANYLVPGVTRWTSPEDANADASRFTPEEYQELMMMQVPPVVPIEGDFIIYSADYNTIANYQYVRAGLDLVGAVGRNDQSSYQMVHIGGQGSNPAGRFRVGGAFAGNMISTPNMLLGFQIEWGVNLLNFAPFTMRIHTHNFETQALAPVDRDVTLRISPRGGHNGGVMQILFAQRLSPSDTAGYIYTASGGMNKAIVQPCWLPTISPPLTGDGGQGLPALPGLTLDNDTSTFPYIDVDVSSSLASDFSATIHVLSAASTHVATLREALFLDGIVQQGVGQGVRIARGHSAE